MPDWTVSIQSTIFFINVSVNVTEFAVSAHFFVSFVSIHVYLSVPLNSITRCDYNVFGTTLPSISCLIFSLGPPNRCACMDVSSVCVCVWAVWLQLSDRACLMEGRRKGWSDGSDTGGWGGSQVEVVMIPQEGPLGAWGGGRRDMKGGI